MDDEKFISLVQENDLLYNKHNKNHKNAKKKEKAWASISHCMGINAEQCIQRWQALRNRYCKELRYMKSKAASGANIAPRWPLFNDLSFMSSHVASRDRHSQLSNCNIGDDQTSSFSSESKMFVTRQLSNCDMGDDQTTSFSSESKMFVTPDIPQVLKAPHSYKRSRTPDATNEAARAYTELYKKKQSEDDTELRSFADFIVSFMRPLSSAARIEVIAEFTRMVSEKRMMEEIIIVQQ